MIDKSKPYGQVIAEQQAEHGKRVSMRHAINGQPNGYKPMSEEDMQLERQRADAIANGMGVKPNSVTRLGNPKPAIHGIPESHWHFGNPALR